MVERWGTNRMVGCYVSSLPVDAMKSLAGFPDVSTITRIFAAEVNLKAFPTFSRSGRQQDTIKFLDDFHKVCKWNNWIDERRKKEIFLLSLEGAADRWVTNFKAKDEAKFAELTFDNDLDNSLISAFKKKFVTNYWKEVYLKQYEEYRQSLNEISLEYLETKCYLLQKANLSKEEKPVKQQIRDILNGLVPQVYQFCDHAIKDPYRKDIKESPKTIDGLETIFAWAEECLYTIYNTISYKSDHVASVAQPQVVRSTQPVYTVVQRNDSNMNHTNEKPD
ncbi:hypothetical protein BD560DRAFT_439879 [Blakeslea trispora]|nr:hypothetical protein BD560DRAFT_439879 [Blakeslea trispora]